MFYYCFLQKIQHIIDPIKMIEMSLFLVQERYLSNVNTEHLRSPHECISHMAFGPS